MCNMKHWNFHMYIKSKVKIYYMNQIVQDASDCKE